MIIPLDEGEVSAWWNKLGREARGIQVLVRWVMVASSLFTLYTAGFGLLSALTQRSIHWVFMSFPIFLLFPMVSKNKGKVTWIDYLLALGAAGFRDLSCLDLGR